MQRRSAWAGRYWLNRATSRRLVMTNGAPTEQGASLLATRLAVICGAEVAPCLPACYEVSVAIFQRPVGVDDVIVTWSSVVNIDKSQVCDVTRVLLREPRRCGADMTS